MVAIVDATPTWAESVGKRARLTVEGGTLRIPARLADVLPAVSTHLVRNSLSHGIELPGIRDAAGKDIVGHLSMSCIESPGGSIIEYRDDGTGFDFEKLEAAAGGKAAGAEAAFADGVSTTTGDDLSGRGVGLSAVREELAEAGYDIELSNAESGGALVRLRPRSK
jgi:chemotaxis protein histidine kinase CheA